MSSYFPFWKKHRRNVEGNWFCWSQPLSQSRRPEDKKHNQDEWVRAEKKGGGRKEERRGDGDSEAERLLGQTNRAAVRGAYFPNTICSQSLGWKLCFCQTSYNHTPVKHHRAARGPIGLFLICPLHLFLLHNLCLMFVYVDVYMSHIKTQKVADHCLYDCRSFSCHQLLM